MILRVRSADAFCMKKDVNDTLMDKRRPEEGGRRLWIREAFLMFCGLSAGALYRRKFSGFFKYDRSHSPAGGSDEICEIRQAL